MNPRQYGPQVLPPARESTRILKERLNATPAERRQDGQKTAETGDGSGDEEVRPH